MNLKPIEDVEKVVVKIFRRENRKSNLSKLVLCRNDGSPEAFELASVAQKVLEVGEGQCAVKAISVRPCAPNVTEAGLQALYFFQESCVVTKLLHKAFNFLNELLDFIIATLNVIHVCKCKKGVWKDFCRWALMVV